MILEETFKNSNIKVIIWSNNIDYEQITDRNRIFDMYPSSTIGAPSGVNQTYNRIKEKYIWENLKLDIQNRIKIAKTVKKKKIN